LAGAGHAAFFNVFRRFRHQILYVAPPFIAAYAAMNWAIERYASLAAGMTVISRVWIIGWLTFTLLRLGTTTSTPSLAALRLAVRNKLVYKPGAMV
jgi:hypothetical protein